MGTHSKRLTCGNMGARRFLAPFTTTNTGAVATLVLLLEVRGLGTEACGGLVVLVVLVLGGRQLGQERGLLLASLEMVWSKDRELPAPAPAVGESAGSMK
jgi:hypothetical protein